MIGKCLKKEEIMSVNELPSSEKFRSVSSTPSVNDHDELENVDDYNQTSSSSMSSLTQFLNNFSYDTTIEHSNEKDITQNSKSGSNHNKQREFRIHDQNYPNYNQHSHSRSRSMSQSVQLQLPTKQTLIRKYRIILSRIYTKVCGGKHRNGSGSIELNIVQLGMLHGQDPLLRRLWRVIYNADVTHKNGKGNFKTFGTLLSKILLKEEYDSNSFYPDEFNELLSSY